MFDLCVTIDHYKGQECRREQLLALLAVRECLESRPSGCGRAAATLIERTIPAETDRARTVRDLYELIAALDRRAPQVQRVGEVAIAREAAALRIEALKRLEEFAREPAHA